MSAVREGERLSVRARLGSGVASSSGGGPAMITGALAPDELPKWSFDSIHFAYSRPHRGDWGSASRTGCLLPDCERWPNKSMSYLSPRTRDAGRARAVLWIRQHLARARSPNVADRIRVESNRCTALKQAMSPSFQSGRALSPVEQSIVESLLP